MGLLDMLLGRSKPARPNLDVLFAVPAAATTLRADLNLSPTGVGAVCFKSAEGEAAARAATDALALLSSDTDAHTDLTTDQYGYTWVTRRRADADLAALVTDLHAVNTTVVDAGFGPSLLCTVVGFRSATGSRPDLALVYLFKRGTFYPFAPTGPRTRNADLELQIRAHLTGELPIEPDLSRWFPIWGTPVL